MTKTNEITPIKCKSYMINVKKTIDFLKQMKKQNKNFNFNANYYTSIVSNYLNSQNIEDNKNNS